MDFINTWVRRQDRLLDKEASQNLLKHGEYGVLSMQAEDGGSYGVPLNFAWDGDHSIYIHCAPQGRKLQCLARCNRISFCVVGKTCVVPDRFTTAYVSIIMEGSAHTGLSEEERKKALELLLDKYSPSEKVKGLESIEKSFHRTEIVRLDIASWSGKCKHLSV
jgi:nitroimidazol reductase NimA-like FMN-containing flavoprotein (pyridoxamine 5'-phosphate oxidase superfamily)